MSDTQLCCHALRCSWKAAKSDEAIGLINEVNDEFLKTFFIQVSCHA